MSPTPLNLDSFTFETVTVNRQGEIIERQTKTARYFREDLGNRTNTCPNRLETLLNKALKILNLILEALGSQTLRRFEQQRPLDMVYIPGGSFTMGAPVSTKDSSYTERPQHQVTVAPFLMGKYAITNAQWRAVAALPKLQRDLNLDPSRFKEDNLPVNCVSWYDAIEFCARLSVATGRKYVLPSEAQWEYACRGYTTTPFHFGETITTEIANYNNHIYADEPKGENRQKTTPVGSFPPNSFGLYDMHGNIWEWCADPWHDSYEKAPTDGTVWDEKCDYNRYQNYAEYLCDLLVDYFPKVFRGGSWYSSPSFCCSTLRGRFGPDDFNEFHGFRVVCVSHESSQ